MWNLETRQMRAAFGWKQVEIDRASSEIDGFLTVRTTYAARRQTGL
jgi:hypothetical protein